MLSSKVHTMLAPDVDGLSWIDSVLRAFERVRHRRPWFREPLAWDGETYGRVRKESFRTELRTSYPCAFFRARFVYRRNACPPAELVGKARPAIAVRDGQGGPSWRLRRSESDAMLDDRFVLKRELQDVVDE